VATGRMRACFVPLPEARSRFAQSNIPLQFTIRHGQVRLTDGYTKAEAEPVTAEGPADRFGLTDRPREASSCLY